MPSVSYHYGSVHSYGVHYNGRIKHHQDPVQQLQEEISARRGRGGGGRRRRGGRRGGRMGGGRGGEEGRRRRRWCYNIFLPLTITHISNSNNYNNIFILSLAVQLCQHQLLFDHRLYYVQYDLLYVIPLTPIHVLIITAPLIVITLG